MNAKYYCYGVKKNITCSTHYTGSIPVRSRCLRLIARALYFGFISTHCKASFTLARFTDTSEGFLGPHREIELFRHSRLKFITNVHDLFLLTSMLKAL